MPPINHSSWFLPPKPFPFPISSYRHLSAALLPSLAASELSGNPRELTLPPQTALSLRRRRGGELGLMVVAAAVLSK
uniref:Uncharacterized protein n=1 Tax=Rhizophora mucronata TaxID=61149 RepID=A0A2P2PJQ4_RHIMU